MAFGFELFNASAVLSLDHTMFALKFIGSLQTGTSAGSITVPEFATPNSIPFAVVITNDSVLWSPTQVRSIPDTAISGTTLSWVYPGAAVNPVPCTIVYGLR